MARHVSVIPDACGNCLLQINEYSERQYSHKIYLVRSFVVLVLPLQTITRYCQYEQVIKITIFQTGLSPSDHQKSGDELTTVHVTKLKLNVSSAQAHSSYWPNMALAQVARRIFC